MKDFPDEKKDSFFKTAEKNYQNCTHVLGQLQEKVKSLQQQARLQAERSDEMLQTLEALAKQEREKLLEQQKEAARAAEEQRSAAYRRCAERANKQVEPETSAQSVAKKDNISRAFEALEADSKVLAKRLFQMEASGEDSAAKAWALLGLGNLSLEITPESMGQCMRASVAIRQYSSAIKECQLTFNDLEAGGEDQVLKLPNVAVYNRFVAGGKMLQTGLAGMQRSLRESRDYYLQLMQHLQTHKELLDDNALMKEVRELLLQTHPELDSVRVITEEFLQTVQQRFEVLREAGIRRSTVEPSQDVLDNRTSLDYSQRAAEEFCHTLSELKQVYR